MLERPPICRGCPADKIARGFVPASGPTRGARIAFVGQGPGADEAAFGEPFIGESGRRLNAWCARAKIPRDKVAISNVVWCQLPKNRAPTAREARYCWGAHVRPWLDSLSELRVVVPIGVPAMQVLISPKATASTAGTTFPIHLPWKGPYGEASIRENDVRGLPQRDGTPVDDVPTLPGEAGLPAGGDDLGAADVRGGPGGGLAPTGAGRLILAIPTLHPAFIVRGQFAQEPAQARFLARAWKLAAQDTPLEIEDVAASPIGCVSSPDLTALRAFHAATAADEPLACDIEGVSRITGIGFGRLSDEACVYVPFLDAELPYWPEGEWPEVDTTVRSLLARPLWFHNGQASDIPKLEAQGYTVPRYVGDTMILHWAMYAEQPKDLETLAVNYLGMPAWKFLSSAQPEENK